MSEWRVSLGLCILLRPTAQRSAVHLISFVPALYSHGIRALCFGYAPDRCYMAYTTSRYDGPGPWHLQLQIWLWKWRCLPRRVQLEPLPWRQRVYTWVNLWRRWWRILPPALAVCFERGVHTTNIHDLEYRAGILPFWCKNLECEKYKSFDVRNAIQLSTNQIPWLYTWRKTDGARQPENHNTMHYRQLHQRKRKQRLWLLRIRPPRPVKVRRSHGLRKEENAIISLE